MPKVSETYADPLLTNIAVRYANSRYYADQIFPNVAVTKKTGYYYVYDKANLRSEDDLRTGRAKSRVVDHGMTKTAYGPLLEHSLKSFIERDELDQSDNPVDPRTDHTEAVRDRMLVNKEVALATMLASTSIVTKYVTKSGTGQWSDYTSGVSDPYGDLETGIESVRTNAAKKANLVAMSKPAYNKLKYHPDTIEMLKATGGGKFTTERLADWLEVEQVLILDSVYNSADEGATDVLEDIWGKHVWVLYRNPNPTPSVREASAGYHLTLTDGVQVFNYPDADEADTGEWVKCKDYYEQKLVAVGAIYAIRAAVA